MYVILHFLDERLFAICFKSSINLGMKNENSMTSPKPRDHTGNVWAASEPQHRKLWRHYDVIISWHQPSSQRNERRSRHRCFWTVFHRFTAEWKKKRFSRNGCFFSLDFFWVICMIGTVCILMWLIYIYIIFYYFNKNTIFFIHLNVPTRVPIYYILLF